MDQVENAPRLRFSGFTDAWEQREFKSFAQRKSEMGFSSSVPSVEYEDIIPDQGRLNKDVSQKESHKIGIKFSTGDVLFGKLRPYLKNWLLPAFSGVAVGDFWVLKPSGTDSRFLYYLIQTSAFFTVSNQSAGSKMPRADWNLVSQYVFHIPSEETEQVRIGSFFRRLDDLITLHQRKQDALMMAKKALLEKMFPQGDEKTPQVRFNGFTDAWEQRKVKEVCFISTGKSNTQDKIDDGKYPFYVRSPIIERSNRYLYDEEAVLTVGDGVGTGKVFHYVNGKYDLHQRVYRLYGFFNDIDTKFFYHWFSEHFYDRVMSMTAKTSVDSVRLEMIADMEMTAPSLVEQKKITSILDYIDRLITLHRRKVEQLKKLKMACLEKMFV